MYLQNALETTANVNTLQLGQKGPKISELIPAFVRHIRFELGLANGTAEKYQEALGWIIKDLGDLPVTTIGLLQVTELKQKITMRGAGSARAYSIIFALRGLLKFCQEALELQVLHHLKIKAPRSKRREVLFLSNEEITQFIDSINIYKKFHGDKRGKFVRLDGLRFRTLVEVLLGTGMRISEALSLDRDKVDFEKGEAKIIGKGSKERVVFFNPRSLEWVRFYLDERKDQELPVFVTNKLTRLRTVDISRSFRRQREISGINKKITPHILRHTTATNLLFNGCPISHVKEILGHERLETTCRFYLEIDKSKAKEAHGKFLSFEK